MKNRWMPIFWGDFFANTLHLRAYEIGAYLLLIAHAWENEGKIPWDEDALRNIARVDARQWSRVWKKLQPMFEHHQPEIRSGRHDDRGYLLSRRVVIELHKAAELSNKRKVAGLASARQMHNKRPNFVTTKLQQSHPHLPSKKESLLLPRASEDEPKQAADKKAEEMTLAEINTLQWGASKKS